MYAEPAMESKLNGPAVAAAAGTSPSYADWGCAAAERAAEADSSGKATKGGREEAEEAEMAEGAENTECGGARGLRSGLKGT